MTMIEDALQEWDDMFHFKPLRGRGAKLTITGVRVAQPCSTQNRKSSPSAVRSRVSGIVRKTPEVVVKVSGGGKGMRSIKAHMDYISRNVDVVLENENGELIDGKEAVRDLRNEWKLGLYGIPEDSHRKEAFNIVLSMPPGTDRTSVTDAAREFAKAEFGRNFQYVFATHEDESHPHVHLCVKAQGMDGTRLNPRKPDLQRWREGFAEALREHGIEANATPRSVRGARRRTRPQAALHGKTPQRRTEAPERQPAVLSGKVLKGYRSLAQALAQGDKEDRSLALGIVGAVKGMTAKDDHEAIKRTEPRIDARGDRTPPSTPRAAPKSAPEKPSHER